jgi:methyl-accepting chemotaxis protein
MQEMAKTAGHIASGDLSVKVNTRGDNDSMGLAFNKMIANLKDTISSLQNNAVAMDEASNQLTQGADLVNEAYQVRLLHNPGILKGSNSKAESVQ